MRFLTLPFIQANPNQPPLSEGALHEALLPAFPGLEDVGLLPQAGSEFWGSNVELRKSAISAGVHPALRIRSSEASSADSVTLQVAHQGSARIRSSTGRELILGGSTAVFATRADWSLESTDYAGLVVRVPRVSFLHKLSLLIDGEPALADQMAIGMDGKAGNGFINTLRALHGLFAAPLSDSGVYDDMLTGAVALLVAQGHGSCPRTEQRMAEMVERARALVRDNAKEKLTISDLSRSLGISERYLQLCFQSVAGVTPKQWILSEKLEFAWLALKSDPALSIAAASEIYGFSSPSHFSLAFKKRFGVSPNKIR